MRLGAAKTANAGSAAHRKSDQRRDDPGVGGLRKRVGGTNCMWAGGSDVCPSSENQYEYSANTGRAFPSAGETTLRMESRLSAFTMTVRFIGSSVWVCSDL